MSYKIFTVNPGSTSTKVALFHNEKKVFSRNVEHDITELAQFQTISDQLPFRISTIEKVLKEDNILLEGVTAIVGRGGAFHTMEGGVYELDELMLNHTIESPVGIQHPANLGVQIAWKLQQEFGGRVFMVNPPVVDEFDEIARITGIKGVYRRSYLHSLNIKEVGIRYANSIGKNYGECNLIICHLGGGISVSAHRQGRMFDGNDIIGGEGPLAPTRCGTIPVSSLIKLCFSGQYSEKEILAKCTKSGGFVDLLGTADTREVVRRAKMEDKDAKRAFQAMIYQIIKYIGSMATALSGKVEGIVLTGGMANESLITDAITESCSFIAPVVVYPGEFEMEAMANGAIRVLDGKEQLKKYTGKPVWQGFLEEL